MKQLVAISVFFAILGQTFSKDLIVAHFYLNRDYIAAHFCENKNKPKMHCAGQCHLKKTLKKEAQRETNLLLQDRHDINLFCVDFQVTLMVPFVFFDRDPYFFYNDRVQKSVPNPIFHPPAVFV